ncbi:MAG: sulfite exporter TauE/SafE family protein [Thermoleophilaceae bacterium]
MSGRSGRPPWETAAPLDPLELIAFCAWCFAVALAGGVVGLVLGNIRLPATLLLASHPAAGAGANIGISGVAATAAAIVHIRAGRINWRLFAWMAPPSMVGAVAGGYLSGAVPDAVLLGVIGAVLLYFGVDLVRAPVRPARRNEARSDGLDVRAAVLTGLGIGVLGGVVGLILGALRMPALIRYVGETAARAVGTNLAVGVCVGIAGVIGHTPDGVDWDLLAIGSAASVPGALLGARLTGRLSERQLLRAIGAMLVIAGVATVVQALV